MIGKIMLGGQQLNVLALLTVVVVIVLNAVFKIWRRKEERGCTDFIRAVDELQRSSQQRVAEEEEDEESPIPLTPPPPGELLVADASVSEVSALAERLEKSGIRFEVRQTVIDTGFHRYGNGGSGTRMCVYVDPADVESAGKIANELGIVVEFEETAEEKEGK